jgi:hypothetical protein
MKDRRGVCQDFAHLMIGLCRSLKIPARYVSGYLATESASATHAWVEVSFPATAGAARPDAQSPDRRNLCEDRPRAATTPTCRPSAAIIAARSNARWKSKSIALTATTASRNWSTTKMCRRRTAPAATTRRRRITRPSIHGMSHAMGASGAAQCWDCHGSHEILPVKDPASPVFKMNLPRPARNATATRPHQGISD